MIPQVQHSQNFDVAAAPMEVEEEGEFQWTQVKKSIFNSACLALIYLNGGKLELAKERVTHGNATRAIYPKAIKHIIDRGSFPGVSMPSKEALTARCYVLRQKNRNSGLTWEEELLKQYQTLQTTNIVNDRGEEIPALLQELNKFGIKPEEYDQWVPIESCFKWDEEREAIFKSACFALIYLNGGKLELANERVTHAKQKSVVSHAIVEQILEKGNFPEFKTLPKGAVKGHIDQMKLKNRKKGGIWEEELLKQYQEREAKIIATPEGKEIPAIYCDLDKFGIKPEEYDQWLPVKSCFKWNKEREAIFTAACIALIYLNGGKVELEKERAILGSANFVVSATTIEHILERGNFPEFKTLSKKAINAHICLLKRTSKKSGSTWQKDLLERYRALEAKTIVHQGKRVSALSQELAKFGVTPEEYDEWLPIESCFKWDEERKAIVTSACIALIYLNGGQIELPKERLSHSKIKSAIFLTAIEHMLNRGNFPTFKTLTEDELKWHLLYLRRVSINSGSTLEADLLKQYRELEAKTVVNDEGEEIPALWPELNKFGVTPAEYNQWLPFKKCFKWDEERKAIFNSACLTLIYLNGGRVELPKERQDGRKIKTALTARTIKHIIDRMGKAESELFVEQEIENHVTFLKRTYKKNGQRWEQEVQKQYEELERARVVNAEGEEVKAIFQDLNKFGIVPAAYDTWTAIWPVIPSRRMIRARKRQAEEAADPEAEPIQKRANQSAEVRPPENKITYWKKKLIHSWREGNR